MNIILFEKEETFLPSSDERAQHILRVLKLKTGDSFKAGVVNKSEGTALITDITSSGIFFSYSPSAVPVLYPVTMIIAMVRPICMKRILRDTVSLGCSRIILCISDTGEKSYLESGIYKSGEYRSFLLDGAVQSAHAGVPEVLFCKDVEDALSLAPASSFESAFVLDNVSSSLSLRDAQAGKTAALAVGPERGWSNRERILFSEAGYSFMLLGQRVLRTETACCAGLALLLSRMSLL